MNIPKEIDMTSKGLMENILLRKVCRWVLTSVTSAHEERLDYFWIPREPIASSSLFKNLAAQCKLLKKSCGGGISNGHIK